MAKVKQIRSSTEDQDSGSAENLRGRGETCTGTLRRRWEPSGGLGRGGGGDGDWLELRLCCASLAEGDNGGVGGGAAADVTVQADPRPSHTDR